MRQRIELMLLMLATTLVVSAQHVLTLTPDGLFAMADSTEQSLRAGRYGMEAAAREIRAAEAMRLPDIEVSLSASYLGNGYVWNRDFR